MTSGFGRIGLIVPCDLTLDAEYPRYLPVEATVHLTRTGFHPGDLDLDFILGVSSPSEIAYATRSLTKIAPGVISFACTSGSFVLGLEGEMRIRRLMEDAGAELAQTTSGALLDALAVLGVERIGLGTPLHGVGRRQTRVVPDRGRVSRHGCGQHGTPRRDRPGGGRRRDRPGAPGRPAAARTPSSSLARASRPLT